MVISLNQSYESKLIVVLSSDSRFLRSATVRTDHPHWDPHCVCAPSALRYSASALCSDISCATSGCIKIRAAASISVFLHGFWRKTYYIIFSLARIQKIHLRTLFGHIANRVSVLRTFLRFSSFFFIFCKLKPSKRSNLILGIFYSFYIQNTR